MIELSNVTLMGIDCLNVERLQRALDISSREIQFADVKLLTSLSTNYPRTVEIPHIGSIETFSDFCVRDLYKYVETDFVLLVQYDGFVINPGSWRSEFLKYDYVGAPWLVNQWSIDTHNFPQNSLGKLIVGNGGFSLRSKKLLEISSRFSERGAIQNLHPEDVAICVWNRELFVAEGIKFAPVVPTYKS
ncbi:MAG: hypothetical protein HY225_03020 [Candidatus Vogelbacteria bacterium]|nr:hypothetical protein [Candidatus Vogelbacteria bacterium]